MSMSKRGHLALLCVLTCLTDRQVGTAGKQEKLPHAPLQSPSPGLLDESRGFISFQNYTESRVYGNISSLIYMRHPLVSGL